ncbi:MAG: hypothetical protein WAP01_08495, partial [Bacillota bacterium]
LWYMNRWNGYSVCWEVMKDLASEMGIRVVEKEDEFAEDAQMVMHLDTSSGQLAEKNLTLSLRSKMIGMGFEDKFNMNLKYSVPNADAVPSNSVTVAQGIEAEYTYEQDIAGFIDGVIGKNSQGVSLDVAIKEVPEKEFADNTLRAYAKYYPSLAELGIPLDSQMEMIGGARILEYVVTPGELYFGQGAKSKVQFTFWYNLENLKTVIMEMSYRSPLGPDAPADAASKALKFFNALQEEYNKRQFLVPGDMKMQRFMESID